MCQSYLHTLVETNGTTDLRSYKRMTLHKYRTIKYGKNLWHIWHQCCGTRLAMVCGHVLRQINLKVEYNCGTGLHVNSDFVYNKQNLSLISFLMFLINSISSHL